MSEEKKIFYVWQKMFSDRSGSLFWVQRELWLIINYAKLITMDMKFLTEVQINVRKQCAAVLAFFIMSCKFAQS